MNNPIFVASFIYPRSGGGCEARSISYGKLIGFVARFVEVTRAELISIVRRNDVCGIDCDRLHALPCRRCGDPMFDAPPDKTDHSPDDPNSATFSAYEVSYSRHVKEMSSRVVEPMSPDPQSGVR